MDAPRSVFSDNNISPPSADSTSADSFPAQAFRQIDDKYASMSLDHDDSASDISMPVETDDEDEELYGTEPVSADTLPDEPSVLKDPGAQSPKKRKLSMPSKDSHKRHANEGVQEDRKRQRSNGSKARKTSLSAGRHSIPAEIWHHIFTFCPPRDLGKLLQVNKSFNSYLDPSKSSITFPPHPNSALKALSPDAIWAASRRIFSIPGMQIMPAPLHGKSELDMWKLLRGSICQFCSKKALIKFMISSDKWHPGPGMHGVVPVFSLGLRSCGSCLEKQLTKEFDLMISVPGPLMTALPFIFMTNELHVISMLTLQNGQPPPVIKITKYYYKVHVEEIKKEFENVKLLGPPATEEWLKGLEDRGKQCMEDSSRWERWEAAGGLIKMRATATMEGASSGLTAANLPPFNRGGFSSNDSISSNSSIKSLPQPSHLTSISSHLPQPVFGPFATQPPPRFESPAQNGFPSFPARPPGQVRHERTKDEVAGLKAARRSEIERRCMLLTPPLTAGVLAHMASFQAAIQIIQPLTDSAWEVLKPRLLSQREEAQQRENDRLAQTRVVQERFDVHREQNLQAKGHIADHTDILDELQAPLRARTGGYADEIIRDGWNNGGKVSFESSPRFAAEVLVYVRKRFYAEAAKDEAAARATGKESGMDNRGGPFTWRLTLEHMRWVFDTKVKPLTEHHRKELFLCNACDFAAKYYGFEGVIQHFAAKHTSALSAGPVVVHWKSEWPENPPFNPDPASVPAPSFYPAVSSINTSYPASGSHTVPQNFGFGGYPAIPQVYTPNPHVYQESPGPYYEHPQFGHQYGSHQNGPFQPPPLPYPGPPQGYPGSQYPMAPAAPGTPGFHNTSQQFNQQSFDSNQQAQSMYASPHGGTAYPGTVSVAVPQSGLAQPVALRPTAFPPMASYTSNLPQGSHRTEAYTSQLLDLARNAREIWNSIGGLKEIPGSVKVFTIIFHVLARFRDTFKDDPPLSMFVEGLSNNKDMRPVRNVNGLLCKACSLGMAGSTSATQKKHFSFPQLVNHFHSAHEQGVSQDNTANLADWKEDMLLLPDRTKLASIVNAPGMDSKKLSLFTDALPAIIAEPEPEPEPSAIHYSKEPVQYQSSVPDYQENAQLEPSRDNHEKYYASTDLTKQSESPVYGSNEYDPRRPADLPLAMPSQERGISRQYDQQSNASNEQIPVRVQRHDAGGYRDDFHGRPERHYIDNPSPRPIGIDSYGPPAPAEGRRYYLDEPIRYRDPADVVEYRPRQELAPREYYEAERTLSNYRPAEHYPNSRPMQITTAPQYVDQVPYSRPINDAALQQNRDFEVVAQLSRHTQNAKEHVPRQAEAAEVGSEDGEVRVENAANQGLARKAVSDEAADAAERFLNNFQPGEDAEVANRTYREMDYGTRVAFDGSRPDSRLVQRRAEDPYRHPVHHDEGRIYLNDLQHEECIEAPRPTRDYAYDDRYASSMDSAPPRQDRSPVLVDQRYKVNNTIYREERQDSRGPYRAQSRFARYESARLENDRVRSSSPVYVKTGPPPAQYRERSPTAHLPRQESAHPSRQEPVHSLRQESTHPLRQEPIYHSQPPLQHEQPVYDARTRRQELRQVYPGEQRQHDPQYAEAFEFVRVADPQGDYMIRRPVRREVDREPVYAGYEDGYARGQPVYERSAPAPMPPRGEPAFVEEGEYDPRHPEPLAAPVRYR